MKPNITVNIPDSSLLVIEQELEDLCRLPQSKLSKIMEIMIALSRAIPPISKTRYQKATRYRECQNSSCFMFWLIIIKGGSHPGTQLALKEKRKIGCYSQILIAPVPPSSYAIQGIIKPPPILIEDGVEEYSVQEIINPRYAEPATVLTTTDSYPALHTPNATDGLRLEEMGQPCSSFSDALVFDTHIQRSRQETILRYFESAE